MCEISARFQLLDNRRAKLHGACEAILCAAEGRAEILLGAEVLPGIKFGAAPYIKCNDITLLRVQVVHNSKKIHLL